MTNAHVLGRLPRARRSTRGVCKFVSEGRNQLPSGEYELSACHDGELPESSRRQAHNVSSTGTSSAEFSWYRGKRAPRFVHEAERECAEILDFYGVPWEYEPVTFVLETDEDGRVAEAFSPDFYLPEQNLFLEVTTMRQELVTRKNRKVRKLRQRYPDVNVKLFYKRDIEALGQKLLSRQRPVVAHSPLQGASIGA